MKANVTVKNIPFIVEYEILKGDEALINGQVWIKSKQIDKAYAPTLDDLLDIANDWEVENIDEQYFDEQITEAIINIIN